MGPHLTELPLRDIHLPQAVSWWPPALGWWLIFAAAVFLVALSCLAFLRRFYLKPALKSEASKALDQIVKAFDENLDAASCLSQLSQFLRRVMVNKMNEKIGGVTGEAWLKLLDQMMGGDEFSQGVGKVLLKGPYTKDVSVKEAEDLIHLCRRWVKAL